MKKISIKVFFLCLLVCVCCSFSMMTTKASDVDAECEDVADDVATEKSQDLGVSYAAHVQSIGWMDYVSDGATSGTEGKAKRVESFKVKLDNNAYGGSVTYRAHVQSYGWMDWVSDSVAAGTEGKAKRIEAIQIKLTGEIANYYDVYYRVHAQSYGWMGWTCNGETSGTIGISKRVEAIQICLVKKGEAAPGDTNNSVVNKGKLVKYRTHVQKLGWRDYSYDGGANGSWGISKRLEGINISLATGEFPGQITYRTHVQSYGWQQWVSDGALSGTTGKSKRLEAIEIKLTGEIAERYDVYYRVHCQGYGWMSWVKNGETAGTTGQGKRLEAIQILMCEKGKTPNYPAAPTNKMIDPSKPMIAITYDDGPKGDYTDRILDVLESNDAKATFFVLGNKVPIYPEQVKRAHNMGCQIANHTYDHTLLGGKSISTIANKVDSCDNEIEKIIGVKATAFRPPGGSYSQAVFDTVKKPVIMWSVDPQDWKNQNSSYIYNHIMSRVQDGDIILLHDIHYQTVLASERLIPDLIAKGYQLVTIDELAFYKGVNITSGNAYRRIK